LKSYLIFVCIYVKLRFVLLICKFDEEVALRIKSNFLHILTLINIYAKVHLNLFTRYLPKTAAK